jgi:hypothetical protein
VRTLTLLLALLLAVVSHQYLSAAKAKAADVVWLAGDCTVVAQDQPAPTDNLAN